jgi:hypothetical protein
MCLQLISLVSLLENAGWLILALTEMRRIKRRKGEDEFSSSVLSWGSHGISIFKQWVGNILWLSLLSVNLEERLRMEIEFQRQYIVEGNGTNGKG